MQYIIITPAKNEEAFIDYTIRSVLAQTVRPKKWILVDDGSKDKTAEIVAQYATDHEFLRLVRKNSSSEQRSGGSKVIRAFYVGYNAMADHDYDIIVKMDADLTLPSKYFEEVIRCFENNPRVGLCGGYCVIDEKGTLVPEEYSEDHVRGAFKAYRKQCFIDIGGLKQIWSWDGIDESAVRLHGWQLKVLPLPVLHHRPTSKEYNILKHSFTSGFHMYKERVDLVSLFVISVLHLYRRPVIIGSFLYLLGYFISWIGREEKVIDIALGTYIRRDRFKSIRKKLSCFI